MKKENKKRCHICGGVMNPHLSTMTFKIHDRDIDVVGIHVLRCECCGEETMDIKEAIRIEKNIKKIIDI